MEMFFINWKRILRDKMPTAPKPVISLLVYTMRTVSFSPWGMTLTG